MVKHNHALAKGQVGETMAASPPSNDLKWQFLKVSMGRRHENMMINHQTLGYPIFSATCDENCDLALCHHFGHAGTVTVPEGEFERGNSRFNTRLVPMNAGIRDKVLCHSGQQIWI